MCVCVCVYIIALLYIYIYIYIIEQLYTYRNVCTVPLAHPGGGFAAAHHLPKVISKKHRFRRRDDIKGSSPFAFQPKSATEID